MNKTVHIPPDLHTDLKIEAAKIDIPLKELVEKKLRRPLNDKK